MRGQVHHIPNDIHAACLPFSVGLFHACGFIAHPEHYFALHLHLYDQEASTSIAHNLPTIWEPTTPDKPMQDTK